MTTCVGNDQRTIVENPKGGIASILTSLIESSKKLIDDSANTLDPKGKFREGIISLSNMVTNNLMFTKTIVNELEYLGYEQGLNVNKTFKQARSKTEEYARYAKTKALDLLTDVKLNHRQTYNAAERLANRMSNAEVDIFNKTKEDYEGRTIDYRDPYPPFDRIKSIDKAAEFEALTIEFEKLGRMPGGEKATKAVKNMFETYRYFRDSYIRAVIDLIKIRAGEKGVPDAQTSSDTYSRIQEVNREFKTANRDAYLAHLRDGDYILNIYQPLKSPTESDVDDPEPMTLKGELDYNFAFKTKRLRDIAIKELKDRGTPDVLIETFVKQDVLDGDSKITTKQARKISKVYERVKNELKKTILNTDSIIEEYQQSDQGREALDDRNRRLKQVKSIEKQLKDITDLVFPETSVKRQLLERDKKIPGFETDILQTFSEMSNRYATQLGNLENLGDYQTAMDSLQNQIRTEPDRDKKDKAQKFADALENIRVRQTQMPSSIDKVANFANRTGFLWYLGFNPASALINMTQVPGVTMPLLLSRFGNTPKGMYDVQVELLSAYKTVLKNSRFLTSGNMSERLEYLKSLDNKQLKQEFDLTRDELDMLLHNDQLGELRSGMQMYDMEQGLKDAGTKELLYDKFNKASAYMFQKAELVNREVTALAAYRLATKRKMIGKTKTLKRGSLEAFDFTNDMITESQGSYASDQAPQVFMNPGIRFIGMFKKFPAFMAAVYISMFKNMVREALPGVKTQALYQFSALMGMSALMAGATGMPFYYILRDLMNFIFDDPDEPYDFDTSFARGLEDTLGSKGARIVYSGLLNEVTGVDVSSRVGYQASFLLGGGNISSSIPLVGGILGLREIPDYSASEKANFVFDELLGAGVSMGRGFTKGVDDIMQGHVTRGIEKMTPVFIRNPLKSTRYTMDDYSVLTKRGDAVAEDLTAKELIFQFMGLTPSRVSLQYEMNRKAKNMEQAILKRRTTLANQYFLLEKRYGRGSDIVRRFYEEEMKPFSKQYPQLPLDRKFISKSRKIRRKFTKSNVFDGVSLNPSLQNLTTPTQRLLLEDLK
tara:strand:+ start:302 stop:3475 length:3174 start_codon:yes stop_codon:yes gene_type:complete